MRKAAFGVEHARKLNALYAAKKNLTRTAAIASA